MYEKSESTERLLDRTSFEKGSSNREQSSRTESKSEHVSSASASAFRIAVFFLLFYIAVLETVQLIKGSRSEDQSSQLPYCTFPQRHQNSVLFGTNWVAAPANVALQYKNQLIWQDGQHSPFTQPPGPKLDALWDDLLAGTLSRWNRVECILIFRSAKHSRYSGRTSSTE